MLTFQSLGLGTEWALPTSGHKLAALSSYLQITVPNLHTDSIVYLTDNPDRKLPLLADTRYTNKQTCKQTNQNTP